MAKKIIITVIAVILVLAGASAATYQFYIKPKYSEQLIEAADKILKDEEVKKILESEEIQKILESENVKQFLESDDAKEILESDEVNGENSSSENSEKSDDIGKISAKDMAEGMKIAAKLDMDKVKDLVGSDTSAEEKREIMKYVKDTLSDEEIAQMAVLAVKYKESLK